MERAMDRVEWKRRQVLEAVADAGRTGGGGDLTAAEVMTASPNCVRPDTTALELVKLFHAKQFRHLLVTGPEDRLIGVISDRDVIRCIGPDRQPDRSVLEGITAAEIMSTDLVTIGPDTPVVQAVSLMIAQGISCLPVLAEQRLVGIVTNTDLHVALQVLLQTLRRSSPEESLAAAVSHPQN